MGGYANLIAFVLTLQFYSYLISVILLGCRMHVSVCVCALSVVMSVSTWWSILWTFEWKCVCVCVCACVRACVRVCVRARARWLLGLVNVWEDVLQSALSLYLFMELRHTESLHSSSDFLTSTSPCIRNLAFRCTCNTDGGLSHYVLPSFAGKAVIVLKASKRFALRPH